MVASGLLCLMKAPVIVEVTAAPQGSQAQDRLSTSQTPACTRDPHPILHQVPAGTLNHAAGDGIPGRQEVPVLQEVCMINQIVGALIDRQPRLFSVCRPFSAFLRVSSRRSS